jgi:hypothetical protein
MTAATRNDVKFALILQWPHMMYPAFSGEYFAAQVSWIADAIENSAYFRMPDGKPLLGLFNHSGWSANPNRWQQIKDAIGEPIFAVGNNISLAQTLALQGVFAYEYANTGLSGAGRHAYSEVMADDASRDGAVPGMQRVSNRSVYLDRRPFVNPTVFTDQPTQPQWVATMQSAIASTQKVAIIGTWDEFAEQGIGLAPSIQEVTRYLDGIDWARNNSWPMSYTFKWSANWLSCGTSGAWVEYFPDPSGVPGAHDGDQLHSSEVGATRSITLPRLKSCDVYAETGPDCGVFEVYADGVLAATVDSHAPAQTTSALVASLTFPGPLATHTVQVRVTSGTTKLDYFHPTYVP